MAGKIKGITIEFDGFYPCIQGILSNTQLATFLLLIIDLN